MSRSAKTEILEGEGDPREAEFQTNEFLEEVGVDRHFRPKLDKEQIKKILPQRFELLLIDEVLDYLISTEKFSAGSKLTALYQVPNEPIWKEGHIPGNPVMPGTDEVHVAAQAAAAFFGLIKGDGFCRLIGLDKIKFRSDVKPGDQLKIYIEIIKISKIGEAKFMVKKVVGDTEIRVCDGEVKGMFVEKT